MKHELESFAGRVAFCPQKTGASDVILQEMLAVHLFFCAAPTIYFLMYATCSKTVYQLAEIFFV